MKAYFLNVPPFKYIRVINCFITVLIILFSSTLTDRSKVPYSFSTQTIKDKKKNSRL